MQLGVLITIVVYFGLSLAILWAVKSEAEDLYCPNPGCDLYHRGVGAVYARGIPNDTDNQEELLEKLRITTRYDVNSVTWRRCLIFAILGGFIVSFLLLRRFPSGVHMLTAFCTIYLMCYLMHEFYRYELAKPALHHVDDTIKRLKAGQDGIETSETEDSDESVEKPEELPSVEGMLEELSKMPISDRELFYQPEGYNLGDYSSDDE